MNFIHLLETLCMVVGALVIGLSIAFVLGCLWVGVYDAAMIILGRPWRPMAMRDRPGRYLVFNGLARSSTGEAMDLFAARREADRLNAAFRGRWPTLRERFTLAH